MEFELICGLHRDAPVRIDATFPFPVLLISIGSKSGTPFLSETAKACQHYFSNFLTRMQKDTLPPNKPSSVPRGDPPAWIARMRAKDFLILSIRVDSRDSRAEKSSQAATIFACSSMGMPIFTQRVTFVNAGRDRPVRQRTDSPW